MTYSATNYGTAGFTPDPASSDWVDYDSITEEVALSWCFANGVDKDAIEASLAANIDAQRTRRRLRGFRGKLKKGEIQWLRKKQRQFQ